jgi:hypothetical protein
MFMRMMDIMASSSNLYQHHNQYLIYDRMDDVEQDITIVKRLMDAFQKDIEGLEGTINITSQRNEKDIRALRDRITVLEKVSNVN